MIAGVHGILESRGADGAVVRVGEVSLQVFVPTSTLHELGAIGTEVHLHTHLHLREDNVALYGFATPKERELFRVLIGVSGVGPRVALSLLSALRPDQLALAIASGNADLLSQVPGVGKKMASRLALELKGRLEGEWPSVQAAPGDGEIVAALASLGYSVQEAASAVAAIAGDAGLPTEERLRRALQHLAGREGA